MQRQERKQKGITLVALVITIIVLLLLAGVTISLLVGENGIITKAKEGGNRTQQAQEKEKIELAVTASIMEDTDKLTIEEGNLNTELMNEFGGEEEYTLTNNQDGSFLIRIEKSKRTYYIGNSGEVIGEENMKKISNAEELKAFRDEVNSGNSYDGWYVYLTDNITLNNTEIWEPIGLYPIDSPTPDNPDNLPFKGIFDGKGYEVDGIYINTTDKVQGLFGLVNDGTILNLGVGANCNITGGTMSAGVASYLYNNSLIVNCYNKANIHVNNGGGVVGCLNNSKLYSSYNIGNIEGNISLVGGVVGYNINNSTILNAYNEGEITGDHIVGGISGQSSKGAIINGCYNFGNIEATNIDNNISTNAGGIVGFNDGSKGEGIVTNCYNVGTIKGLTANIGGIIGLNRGVLQNSYNIGTIENTGEKLGGIVGSNNRFVYEGQELIGKTTNSYCLENGSINAFGENTGIAGEECSTKTSSELKNLASTLGSAFKTDTNNINNGYPILSWQE